MCVSTIIICPDCGKQVAHEQKCPKCGGSSWIPAGYYDPRLAPADDIPDDEDEDQDCDV